MDLILERDTRCGIAIAPADADHDVDYGVRCKRGAPLRASMSQESKTPHLREQPGGGFEPELARSSGLTPPRTRRARGTAASRGSGPVAPLSRTSSSFARISEDAGGRSHSVSEAASRPTVAMGLALTGSNEGSRRCARTQQSNARLHRVLGYCGLIDVIAAGPARERLLGYEAACAPPVSGVPAPAHERFALYLRVSFTSWRCSPNYAGGSDFDVPRT